MKRKIQILIRNISPVALTKWSYVFLLFVISSCAQIVQPAGGPKDIIPPKALRYIPDSAAVNFKAKTITIIFNEFIQLKELQKELTVSPPMNIQPEIHVKGKTLIIELRDTLRKNLTYTLDFGNALGDYTEDNIQKNFQYVFSTGNHIDTLSMSGTVKNALDQKADKDILVLLYESLNDSTPYKKIPSYFARTNADGSYKISHIRPGTYKAFALKEENGNYKYDAPSEYIAFPDSLIKIDKNAKVDFQLFKEMPQHQKLIRDYPGGYGSVFLAYTLPVDSISYQPMNKATKTETFLTEYSESGDTVMVWFPVFGEDSLHFRVTVNKNVTDTVKICTCLFKKKTTGRGERFKLFVSTNTKPSEKFNISNGIEINFNHPINLSSSKVKDIRLTSHAVKVDYTNPTSFIQDKRHFLFHFPLVQDSTYKLFIPPGTFTDIFGLKNDTLHITFKTQEDNYFGTLKMSIKTPIQEKFILQLMNEKGEVFNYANAKDETFNYTYLPPGTYKLRMIYDKNGDGKWTTGNYWEHRQPEPVLYYPKDITIRSNWDLELDWTP